MGLPRDVAHFVWMLMDDAEGSKEGKATMAEYFHALEVAKGLYGVDDDSYFAVSNTLATIMTGM